jgi:O-antigen/teichoic acid export membrane protein
MEDRLKRLIGPGPYALCKGLMAYGLAELSVRVVRLLTVVVIARQLAPDIVGIAALSLTMFELVRVLANVGVGQKIIMSDAALLDATCNTAHRLFWLWCIGVALFQLILAAIVWRWFGQVLPAQMLATLSLVYLFMPGGLVSCYLLMREGRAATTARTIATQTIADHLLTALLLLAWQSPWSIILPKLLTAPIWLIMTRTARPWHPVVGAGAVSMRDLLSFGLPVLATEIMAALRTQMDKLIIAASFGLTALGTWFFAFNAGIGIASSLITAFGTLAFPSLCNAGSPEEQQTRLKMLTTIGALLFVPLAAAQAGLAPYYVPLIFGAHWVHAVPLIALLCLATIPMTAAAISTAWLRANGRPAMDALAAMVMTAASLAGLWAGAATGSIMAAAFGWVGGAALIALPFTAITLWRALSPLSPISNKKAIA